MSRQLKIDSNNYESDAQDLETFKKLDEKQAIKLSAKASVWEIQKRLNPDESRALVLAIQKEKDCKKLRKLKNDFANSEAKSSSIAAIKLMRKNASNSSKFDAEDLEQENLLGKYLAATRFDLSKSPSFNSYSYHYGKNEMSYFVKKTLKYALKANGEWETFNVDSLDLNLETDPEKTDRVLYELNSKSVKSMDDKLIKDEKQSRLYQLINKLNGNDKELIMMYLANMCYSDMAKKVGLTGDCVEVIINRLKVRINRLKIKLKKMNEELKWD